MLLRFLVRPFGFAILAALSLCLVTSSHAINVTQVSASYIYAETNFNRYEIKDGIFYIYFRSPTGEMNLQDRAAFNLNGTEDQLFWSETQAPLSPFDSPYFGTNLTRLQFNFTSWTVRYDRPSSNTVRLIMNATIQYGCYWELFFLLVEQPTLYTTRYANFTVFPHEVKLELQANCPWRWQVRNATAGLDPAKPIYLRARRVLPLATIQWNFKDLIVTNATTSVRANQTATVGFFPEWIRHVSEQNMSNMDVIPPRNLSANFNFSAVGGYRVPSTTIAAGIFFLPWGISDDRHPSFVDGSVSLGEAAKLTPYSFFATALLQTEFADDLFYDPTLEFLFLTPPIPPSNEPQSTEEAVIEQGLNIAIPISVTVAVVVAIAIAAAVVYLIRKRNEQDRSRIRHAASAVQRDSEAPKPQSAVTHQQTHIEPVNRPKQSWKTTRPTEGALRHTQDEQQ